MKIFFVDDEPLTLQYLEKILDWDSLNIQIMGTASNGKEALKQIEKEQPDILITDIRMPVMDGISLIDEVRKFSENIRIIVLSAYSDFEYARKVFSSGISGYLVKPIDEDKLLESIKKTITEIENAELEKEKSSYSQTLAIETLLWDQIRKPNTEDIFNNKCRKLKIAPDLSSFQLLSISFSDPSITNDMVMSNLQGAECSQDFAGTYLTKAEASNWLLVMEEDISSIDVLKIQKHFQEKLDKAAFLTVSGIHHSSLGLPVAFEEILYLNSLHYYATDSTFIFYRKRNDVNQQVELKLNDAVELYFSQIKNHDVEALFEYLNDMDDKLIDKFNSDIAGYQNFWTLFVLLVRTGLNKYEKNLQIPQALKQFNSSSFQSFHKSSGITDFIKQLTLDILQTPASVSGDSSFSPIKNVKNYIHEHFSEKLTLEDIADHFNMSKNYLCRIFKDTAGCTLWDYLTMIRVEHAKHLLEETNNGTAKIALSVGYDNQGYFSSVFKKKTGVSPKQYRKSLNNKGLYP
jgi:two-component system, response regulator YesN